MTDVNELAGAPYFKAMAWMSGELGLKGSALTVFALMFEREHSIGDDRSRIDAAYLCEAIGQDASTVFAVLSDLVRKGYLTLNLSGSDFVGSFTVDMDEVCAAIEAKRSKSSKKKEDEEDES